MKVKAEYISRVVTVIFPALFIIAAIFFIPFMAYKYLKTDSFILKLLVNVGGIACFIYLVIKLNPYLVKIARMKRGIITLNGSILKWNFIFIRKSVDLSLNHTLEIFSGPGLLEPQNTTIVITDKGNSVNICFPQMERHEAVGIFKEDDFIDKLSVPPEEGSGGFNLFPEKGEHRTFFTSILKLAWEQKELNRAFRNFKLFPWEKKPNPDVQYTRLLDDTAEINNYKDKAVITIGADIFLLTDYILAHDVSQEKYYLFPLGQSIIEIAPRTRLLGGTTGSVSHYNVLELKGKDNTGESVAIDVEKQLELNDDYYKEWFLLKYCEKVYAM